jgi:hypothetical protein
MALLRSQTLRLLLIAAVLATFAVPWILDLHRVAVDWYGFEFTTTPTPNDNEINPPHPGDIAPLALFRAFATVTAGIALACILAITRKAWRPGVDLVATLAISGLAVGITLSAMKDGSPATRLAIFGGAAMLLALWSLAAPLLGNPTEDDAEEYEEEDEDEEEDEEDED